MSITCKDLLQLKLFKNITLAAGAEGLSHVITWPYVAQTDTISDWVHGGELLFVTGIAHTENMLPELLEECIRKKLAGLVILTGSEYISQLPPYIIHRADEARFPVFAMPWEIKLIDVTREITNLIVYDQLERKKSVVFSATCSFLLSQNFSRLLTTPHWKQLPSINIILSLFFLCRRLCLPPKKILWKKNCSSR